MPEGLRWIADADFDNYCLTFARGLTPEELVRRMGGDADLITEPISLEDALQLDDGLGMVALVGRDNGWAFAVELNSAEGEDRKIIENVSRGTEVIVLTKSFSSPSMFRLIRDGRSIAEFEVYQPDRQAVYGEDPEVVISAMERSGFLLDDGASAEPDDGEICALWLAEEEFGLSIPEITSERGMLPAVNLEPAIFHRRSSQ
ncbi:DUF6461 domain-containing protein [Streptomyces sp. LN699]|uniref:DUF6461 domain-containing protein n=1 Tax=Streptomyces sp. LN699 TaxID=3112981 RepID=UPI00371D8A97